MKNVFCENLKSARVRAGLTQGQIAAAVGVTCAQGSVRIIGDNTGHKIKPQRTLFAIP